MGYYSTVALAMTKNCYDTICSFVKSQNNCIYKFDSEAERKTAEAFITTSPIVAINGKNIVLYWHDVKWYNIFPEVWFVNQVKEWFLHNHYSYYYIRIGEDIDDITEESCDPYRFNLLDCIQLNRSIDIFPKKP